MRYIGLETSNSVILSRIWSHESRIPSSIAATSGDVRNVDKTGIACSIECKSRSLMLLPNDNSILNEKGSGCPRDNVLNILIRRCSD